MASAKTCLTAEPKAPIAQSGGPRSVTATSCGSVISTDTQVVAESIPLTGIPFSLVYSNDRVVGRSAWYSTKIQVMSATSSVHSSITGVTAVVKVAGQTHTYPLTPVQGLTQDFTWDGLDGSSSPVFGTVEAEVEITESYTPSQPYPAVTKFVTPLGFRQVERYGLGGWSFSVHHEYDPVRKTLYRGDGTSVYANATTVSSDTLIPSQDETEVYVFTGGKHVSTKSWLTGVTLYTFTYNGSGKLSTVTDTYGNTTTVNYTMGVITGITAPFGQVTSITTDGNGYVASVTNPKSEVYSMTYDLGGLLETFEKPNGAISTMTYDALGRLTEDSSSVGSETALTRTATSTGWTIGEVTDSGLSTTHTITTTNPIKYTRASASPSGLTTTYEEEFESVFDTKSDSTGYTETINYAYAPRFTEFTVPGNTFSYQNGYSYNGINNTRSVSFTSGQPFTVTAYTKNRNVNGNLTSSVYSSSTDDITTTSPVGRISIDTLDANERVTESQFASFTPVTYDYDAYGRLEEIAQGVNRVTTLAYNSTSGFLETITNALSQVTEFEYDLAGQVTK